MMTIYYLATLVLMAGLLDLMRLKHTLVLTRAENHTARAQQTVLEASRDFEIEEHLLNLHPAGTKVVVTVDNSYLREYHNAPLGTIGTVLNLKWRVNQDSDSTSMLVDFSGDDYDPQRTIHEVRNFVSTGLDELRLYVPRISEEITTHALAMKDRLDNPQPNQPKVPPSVKHQRKQQNNR